MTPTPQTDEETMAAFDEKFSDSQTMSLERQLGSIKSFLLTSLTNARKESYELGRSDERARVVEVIEGMHREDNGLCTEQYGFGKRDGWNLALADLIEKLKV